MGPTTFMGKVIAASSERLTCRITSYPASTKLWDRTGQTLSLSCLLIIYGIVNNVSRLFTGNKRVCMQSVLVCIQSYPFVMLPTEIFRKDARVCCWRESAVGKLDILTSTVQLKYTIRSHTSVDERKNDSDRRMTVKETMKLLHACGWLFTRLLRAHASSVQRRLQLSDPSQSL